LLGSLWSIDAEETDTSGADVECIAVDHLSTPSDGGIALKCLKMGLGGQKSGSEQR
jgi:hypothetical protein